MAQLNFKIFFALALIFQLSAACKENTSPNATEANNLDISEAFIADNPESIIQIISINGVVKENAGGIQVIAWSRGEWELEPTNGDPLMSHSGGLSSYSDRPRLEIGDSLEVPFGYPSSLAHEYGIFRLTVASNELLRYEYDVTIKSSGKKYTERGELSRANKSEVTSFLRDYDEKFKTVNGALKNSILLPNSIDLDDKDSPLCSFYLKIDCLELNSIF